jgi:phage N-6-adenine-methyltransferase
MPRKPKPPGHAGVSPPLLPQVTRRRCAVCKQPLPPPAATGRRRDTCGDACRARKSRRSGRRSVHFSSRTCEWSTPPGLFDELDREFGFELDVCATAENAKCAVFYDRELNGLAQPWRGVCWMNPPYGTEIDRWVRKAFQEAQAGATVVCLLPARVDTSWWHEYASRGEVRFLRGRLKFGGAANSAPFPSAIVVFRDAATVTKQGHQATRHEGGAR